HCSSSARQSPCKHGPKNASAAQLHNNLVYKNKGGEIMPRQPKRKSSSGSQTASVDAITLLKNDHKEVKAFLKELESKAEVGGSEAEELLQQIESEIKAHTTIEEEIFYPAFKDALESEKDEHIYFEALEEHHVVDMVMPEIKDTDSGAEEFAAKCKVL